MPSVSQSILYTYLAEGVGNKKAFRALKKGYIHWSSGRLNKLEIQTRHTQYAFVRCSVVPSMRTGKYSVKMMLKKETIGDQVVGTVHQAFCECAAGLSACCIHVSALLHALVALKPAVVSGDDSDDENLPVTSQPCQWKAPRKRKSTALQVSEGEFQKHDYGKVKIYKIEQLELFDPRPENMKAKSSDRITELIKNIKGKGLCISLLLDPSICVENPERRTLLKVELLKKIEEFKNTLKVSQEEIREIEITTRDQSMSTKWFEVRRLRITSSLFGCVKQLKPTTPPDNLVLTILGVKRAYGAALQYGKLMEKFALEEYVKYQHLNGVILSHTHPFLGASPDANVYDPSCISDPFGYAEVKCPYKYQDVPPSQAATKSDFMLSKDGDGRLTLKKTLFSSTRTNGSGRTEMV